MGLIMTEYKKKIYLENVLEKALKHSHLEESKQQEVKFLLIDHFFKKNRYPLNPHDIQYDLNIPFDQVVNMLLTLNNEEINEPIILKARYYIECSNVDCKSPIYTDTVQLEDDLFYCLHCDQEHELSDLQLYPKVLFYFNSDELIEHFKKLEMQEYSEVETKGNELSKILSLGKTIPEGYSAIEDPSGALNKNSKKIHLDFAGITLNDLLNTNNDTKLSLEQQKQVDKIQSALSERLIEQEH